MDTVETEWACGYQVLVPVDEMVPLQGGLKRRTQAHVDGMADSIRLHGLLQPVMLWEHGGQKFILDGHGRHAALKQLGVEKPVPAVLIHADSAEDARGKLLEMNAKYGAITPRSLSKFIAESPKVRVPAALGVKLPKTSAKPVRHTARTGKVVTLRVDADKLKAFMDVVSRLSYVEVL
jgi:hypothetical protein